MTARVLTAGWVAKATGGDVVAGALEAPVGDVSIDSRTMSPGSFFVALRGPRHDGHDHVMAALRSGATGALVSRDWWSGRTDNTGRASVVAVPDTLLGLQAMAATLRHESRARVVAITGSAGKTTTKEAAAAMLATRFSVVRNKGNLNNHIGLPLSLMELRQGPDVAVMELGMNHKGEISALVAIARPDVRVWTNVGDAHVGYFTSSDAIAEAKAEILEGAVPADALVCNADDTRVMARVAGFPGRTITFGISSKATVRAVDVEDRGLAGTRCRLTTPAGERSLTLAVHGRGNLANVLAAAGVATHFDVPLDSIVEQAEALRPAERRGAVSVVGGVTIVDDSYNSSPAALSKTLDTLASERGADRKLAVLGEMLEMGAHADRLHRECGRRAAALGLAHLITVGGPPAKAMAEAAVGAGMPASAVTYCESSTDAAAVASRLVTAGDLVLVKGSRGVRTDLVVDRLMGRG